MRKSALFILCAAVMLFAACSAPEASAPPQTAEVSPSESVSASNTPVTDPRKFMVTAYIESQCLQGNLIKSATKKSLHIYLPPSYFESDKAYPVVYYLHGHGEPAGMYLRNNRSQFDNAFKAGAKEFIFAAIDGEKSFYVNSPVSGNWEDYFLTEIIPYVDANYRTIPGASSRGICGFSMGGFGSINLALKHPDVFSAVYSMSPGLLKSDGLSEAMNTWKGDISFLRTYSQAFAPNKDAENLGDIPKLDGADEDNAIIEKWMTGFGNLEQKMQAYIALGTPLKAIGFSYGTGDNYTWIPKGTQYFSDLLNANGINNSLFTFGGGHTQPGSSVEDILVPFFNANLTYAD